MGGWIQSSSDHLAAQDLGCCYLSVVTLSIAYTPYPPHVCKSETLLPATITYVTLKMVCYARGDVMVV